VSGTGNDVGGLVGYNNGTNGGATVSSSYATGKVTGANIVGGLVGDNGASVANTFATGSVSGTGKDVGGLVGLNGYTVSTSYSTGRVSGSSYVGGLVGDNLGAVSSTSFWNITTSGLTTSAEGIGLTTAQMQTEATFTLAGWNFTSIWYLPVGKFPMLQAFESTQ
jgi:hypothetical protein